MDFQKAAESSSVASQQNNCHAGKKIKSEHEIKVEVCDTEVSGTATEGSPENIEIDTDVKPDINGLSSSVKAEDDGCLLLTKEASSESSTVTTDNLNPKNGTEDEIPAKRRRQSLKTAAEMAENYWNKHMAENNTVIAKTFQGIYKSTVSHFRHSAIFLYGLGSVQKNVFKNEFLNSIYYSVFLRLFVESVTMCLSRTSHSCTCHYPFRV